MIDDLLQQCDFAHPGARPRTATSPAARRVDHKTIATLITLAENYPETRRRPARRSSRRCSPAAKAPVLGVTGTGGAGKSSLVDELVRRFLADFDDKHDRHPLGRPVQAEDRRRAAGRPHPHERDRRPARLHALARHAAERTSRSRKHVRESIDICRAAGFDLVIVETSGIGQSDTEITEHADVSLYVMTAEYGAATQLEKIDMLDFADLIAINKFDKRGSLDALRDVRKQYKRNHDAFEGADEALPIYGTIASQFNDPGMNRALPRARWTSSRRRPARPSLAQRRRTRRMTARRSADHPAGPRPLPRRDRRERREVRRLRATSRPAVARRMYQLDGAIDGAAREAQEHSARWTSRAPGGVVRRLTDRQGAGVHRGLRRRVRARRSRPAGSRLPRSCSPSGPTTSRATARRTTSSRCATRSSSSDLVTESLSHLKIPQGQPAAVRRLGRHPHLAADRERLPASSRSPPASSRSSARAKIRRACSPARAARSAPTGASTTSRAGCRRSGSRRRSTRSRSTARIPTRRPDIYGKVGNSGVSIATVDDAKKLYSGFDLVDPATSVSMTINGPAPMLLGFFLNAAVDQQCESWIREQGEARRRGEQPHRRDLREPRRGAAALPGRPPRGQRRPRPHAARRDRRRGPAARRLRADPRRHAQSRCAARCRPTSSRRTRPRTPASSRPSSRCG